MGMFDNVSRPAKTTLMYVPWYCLFPVRPDKGPKEMPSTTWTHPKRLPIKSPQVNSVLSQGQIPWSVPIHESSAADPCKGFTPRTRNRPCVSALKNAYLKPSHHHTGTTTVTRPHQNLTYVIRNPAPPRVIFNKTIKSKHSHTKRNRDACPEQWVRTIRSLVPVRGLTHPSIPPPFHCLKEK